MKLQAAVLCALAVTLTMVANCPGVAAFRLFSGGEPASTGETVRFLVRTVDAPNPYFKSMSFFIPKELNYMLGEYLYKNFTRMLEMHCNVTNITMLVRNDIQLLLTDYDIWTMRNGDLIEIWSQKSGRPTRARTAQAFGQNLRVSGPPCRPGSPVCNRPGRGGKWRTSGSDDGVDVPDDLSKMEVAAEEPIVVPDWSQMP